MISTGDSLTHLYGFYFKNRRCVEMALMRSALSMVCSVVSTEVREFFRDKQVFDRVSDWRIGAEVCFSSETACLSITTLFIPVGYGRKCIRSAVRRVFRWPYLLTKVGAMDACRSYG